jgi:hypothetical protein
MLRDLRMPSRVPLAAALAVVIGAGSLLFYRSPQEKAEEVAEYAETLLEIQGLADDDCIDTGYCCL